MVWLAPLAAGLHVRYVALVKLNDTCVCGPSIHVHVYVHHIIRVGVFIGLNRDMSVCSWCSKLGLAIVVVLAEEMI